MVTLPLALATVLTLISPFINAAVQKVTWSPQTKTLVAIGVSLLIAVAYLALTGGIADWTQLAVVVPAVYTVQQLVFQFLVKNIATKFEALTTPGSTVLAPTDTPENVTVTTDKTVEASPATPPVVPVTATVQKAISIDPASTQAPSPEPVQIVRDDVRG